MAQVFISSTWSQLPLVGCLVVFLAFFIADTIQFLVIFKTSSSDFPKPQTATEFTFQILTSGILATKLARLAATKVEQPRCSNLCQPFLSSHF